MNEREKFYYIEAPGPNSTRIGKTVIMPKEAPVRFSEKQYNANAKEIEHYEREHIIMVSRPGTAASARAAKTIKEEISRLEEVHAGGNVPPPPMVRVMGVPSPPEPVEISTFSTPGKPGVTDNQCWAVTAVGKRCKAEANPDLLVCRVHLAMLGRGKEVLNEDGDRIAKDGKTIDETGKAGK